MKETNLARLQEFIDVITDQSRGWSERMNEFLMHIPARPDKDADLVLTDALNELTRLREQVEWHDLRKDPEDLPERWPVLIMSARINRYLIAKGVEEDLGGNLAWLRNPDWLSAVHEYPLWQYITPPPQGEEG